VKRKNTNGSTSVIGPGAKNHSPKFDKFRSHAPYLGGPDFLECASGDVYWLTTAVLISGATWHYIYGPKFQVNDEDAQNFWLHKTPVFNGWIPATGEHFNYTIRPQIVAKVSPAELADWQNSH